MADNLDWTAGEGKVLATDAVNGTHYPRNKISLGSDGTAVDLDGTVTHGAWVNPRRLMTFVEGTSTSAFGAFSAGDAYSAGVTFATIARDAASGGGVSVIRALRLIDKDNQKVDLDVFWMRDNSSGYTPSDNAAYAPSDAQLLKCCGVTEVVAADYVEATASAQAVVTKSLELPFTLEASDDLIAHIVIRGTPTYTDGLTLAVTVEEL